MVWRDTSTLEALENSPAPPKTPMEPEAGEEAPMDPFLADAPDLAEQLAKLTIAGDTPTQVSQIQHRLNILSKCFTNSSDNNLSTVRQSLADRSILELGCGQGDTTVILAHFASTGPSNTGKVFALDPAPLSYGAPFTLGQAQEHISKSNLGTWVKFIQKDPIDYLKGHDGKGRPDYIVMCHSLWYLSNESYVKDLMKALFGMASKGKKSSRPVKLILAEWGFKGSEEGKAHVLAAEIQDKYPFKEGNVQTALKPERIVELCQEAGWTIEKEDWVEGPDLEDGKWEVENVKAHVKVDEGDEEFVTKFEEMKKLSEEAAEGVKSMDVWVGVFEAS